MSSLNSTPERDSFKLRWDVLLLGVFVFAAMPHATGIFSHEWIGIALVPALVVHLVLNWHWIISTTRQMFTVLPGEIRFNHVWDALLFVMFALATVSGLMISRSVFPALGLPHVTDGFWIVLHTVSATVLTMMIGVHIALHMRWVLARVKKRVPVMSPETAKREES